MDNFIKTKLKTIINEVNNAMKKSSVAELLVNNSECSDHYENLNLKY